MKKKNKKGRITKNIKMFLNSEEGKMLDSDIVAVSLVLSMCPGIIHTYKGFKLVRLSNAIHKK